MQEISKFCSICQIEPRNSIRHIARSVRRSLFGGRTYQKSLNLAFLLCLCPATTARSIKQQTNVAPPPLSSQPRLHFAFAMFVSKFFNLLHKMLGFLASHKSQRNCFNLSWQFSLSSSDKTGRRSREGEGGVSLLAQRIQFGFSRRFLWQFPRNTKYERRSTSFLYLLWCNLQFSPSSQQGNCWVRCHYQRRQQQRAASWQISSRERENEGSAIPRSRASAFALPNLSPSSCSRSLILLVGSQCLTAIWQEFDSSRKSDISLPGINKYLMEAAAHYVGLLCQPKCDRYLKWGCQ